MNTRLAHAQTKNDTQGFRAVHVFGNVTYPQADSYRVSLQYDTQSPRKAFVLYLKSAYKLVESGQDYPGFSARRAAFIAQMRRSTG